tara:strand:+ start:999 stop:1469 length:471 start_codon:yes stop_codon:yes gene_type:complete
MIRLILFLFSFFIVGCNANESFIDPLKPEFESMSFDVVQKQLIIEQELPNHVQNLLSQWFNERVKIDGFDGDMKFIVSNFNQETSSIDDGKRVDVSLSFKVILNKPSPSQTKFIEGYISSYGTLTGNFSLNEFDTVIKNTQSDLIVRLSKDLKSKI